jgi:hypothetical protein
MPEKATLIAELRADRNAWREQAQTLTSAEAQKLMAS